MSTESESIVFFIEAVIFIAIFIPTVIAMVTGAPWVPTPMARVKRMLELAKIKPGERVYDLGCGDGRLVHLAAKTYGADAVGLELSPLVYFWARIRNLFLRSRSRILLRDFRGIDYSNARVLVFYLLPEILNKMRPAFEEQLTPGARIVSYAFEIEGWEPVYVEPKNKALNHARIMVYEIPTSMKANGSFAKK
jgi:SAM-dependent methyltransferase